MMPPRAYVFIGLNGVRILSLVSLLLVFSSNIVTLANDIKAVNAFTAAGKAAVAAAASGTINGNATLNALLESDYISGSTVPNQPAGAFWAVLNRLFIIGQTIVLILSEVGWPSQFFDRFFPVLGKEFGLGALGLIQMLIGAAILSHHVDTFTLVAAFFLFSVGCLNVFVGLVFREGAKSKRSLTSWKENTKSVLPKHAGAFGEARHGAMSPMSFKHQKSASYATQMYGSPYVSHSHTGNSSMSHGDDSFRSNEKSAYGFGRQGEKAAAMRGFFIAKPVECLPKYVPRPE